MNEERKPAPEQPIAVFLLSLCAGLWMLLAGVIGRGGEGGQLMGRDYGGYGWVWRHHHMMASYGGATLWSRIGIAAGIATLIGAFLLFARPSIIRGCGIVILTVSALDLLAGAGGLIAACLGIGGGILAITWKPVER